MRAQANRPGIVAEAATIAGRSGPMFGIVSRPAAPSPRPKAMIFLGKTAPGDVWRWLAEALARAGWIVLRFEPCGLGDSPGGNPDVDMPMLQYFRGVQEGAYTGHVEDAVDWMSGAYQPDEIYLCGICANCSSVLAAAASRRSVTGVILSTPAVLYVQLQPSLGTQDAESLVSGYRRRLFSPTAYLNLLTGRSAYRDIWQSIRWLLGRPRALVRRARARLDRRPKPSHPHFNLRLWEALRTVLERRTPVLALVAEHDVEAVEFTRELKEPVIDRCPEYRELCTVRVLTGADHSLVADNAREQALAAMLDWFGSLEEPARASNVG